MKDDSHKKALLDKYLNGRCSPEELSQLFQDLQSNPSDEAYRAVADQLWEQIQDERTLSQPKAESLLDKILHQSNSGSLPTAFRYRIAAVVAGFVLLAGAVFYLLNQESEASLRYMTDYGETKTILLPDSSRVMLNAHSSLLYRADQPQLREVWLEGEAFFEVRELTTASSEAVKFIVHTDNLDIEVLGTSFNVNDRRGNTQVVLKSGKIRLETKHAEQLTLHPGDMAQLSAQAPRLIKQPVNPDDYTVWREKKLVFKRTPLQEVARVIEDYYGLNVVLEGEGWSDRKITGSIPTRSREMFLEVLAESMGIQVTQKDDRVVLHTTKQSDSPNPK